MTQNLLEEAHGSIGPQLVVNTVRDDTYSVFVARQLLLSTKSGIDFSALAPWISD